MAAPSLALGEPLMQEHSRRPVGKVLGLCALVIGLGCAALWVLNNNAQAADSATSMAAFGARPMQMQKVPQPMQVARSFRQPVQASNQMAGLLDMVIPDKDGRPVDIEIPITKREMMMGAAAAAATAFTGSAQAATSEYGPVNRPTSDKVKKLICASNPASKACIIDSYKPKAEKTLSQRLNIFNIFAGSAQAETSNYGPVNRPTSDKVKKLICASNPASKACIIDSFKPKAEKSQGLNIFNIFTGSAQAATSEYGPVNRPTSDKVKKLICASNPASKACIIDSFKPKE